MCQSQLFLFKMETWSTETYTKDAASHVFPLFPVTLGR